MVDAGGGVCSEMGKWEEGWCINHCCLGRKRSRKKISSNCRKIRIGYAAVINIQINKCRKWMTGKEIKKTIKNRIQQHNKYKTKKKKKRKRKKPLFSITVSKKRRISIKKKN